MAKYIISSNQNFCKLASTDAIKDFWLSKLSGSVAQTLSDSDFTKIANSTHDYTIDANGNATVGSEAPDIQHETSVIKELFDQHLQAAKDIKDNESGAPSDLTGYYDTIKFFDPSTITEYSVGKSAQEILIDNSMTCDKWFEV